MPRCNLWLGWGFVFFACGVILTCVARPLNVVISNPAELKVCTPAVCKPSAPPFQTSVPPVWYRHYLDLKAPLAHVGSMVFGRSTRPVVRYSRQMPACLLRQRAARKCREIPASSGIQWHPCLGERFWSMRKRIHHNRTPVTLSHFASGSSQSWWLSVEPRTRGGRRKWISRVSSYATELHRGGSVPRLAGSSRPPGGCGGTRSTGG